ncbi:unnamed protein product [Effrenium voratum]|uniref:Uncharacterized protein n=1 Tax=Effrenium voratum TaxID=2562239 RepID=A0AA36MHN8_9DINO|nr:unnamed protein product [Effrenium voratum]CAJ1441444.1 unnamed protein product [Effrenium voratum]CAJ1452631.1 unnamed protein product [Effrenium voratum]
MAFVWQEPRLQSTGVVITHVLSLRTKTARIASRQDEAEAKRLLQLCLEVTDPTLQQLKQICKAGKTKDRG